MVVVSHGLPLHNIISSITNLLNFFSSIPSHSGLPAEIEQELWLKEAVLTVFPDTRDCSPSLVRLVTGDFKTDSRSKFHMLRNINYASYRPVSLVLKRELGSDKLKEPYRLFLV